MEASRSVHIVAVLGALAVCGVAAEGSPYATNPEPPDGSVHDAPLVVLGWTAGDGAATHDLYFGSDFEAVSQMDPSVKYPRMNPAGLSELIFGLVPGTTYYWRIVEQPTNAVGPVWRFFVLGLTACNPNPADGSEGVDPNVTLTWSAGHGAFIHHIYFSTDFDEVNDVDPHLPFPPPSYKGSKPVGDETYWPGLLELGVEYFWRIDEEDHATRHRGDVWRFTVASQWTYYVDWDAPGDNDGSSWADAFNYLQDALAAANSLGEAAEVLVAEGTYKPDQGAGITPGDRMATFQLINGVNLKGGYAGYGEPDPEARGIDLYETVLSGDLNGDDVEVNDPCDLPTEPTRAENSLHVVVGNGTDATAVLDGFTITGGNYNIDGFLPSGGGGICNASGSPKLVNCTFRANSAGDGGGMYNENSSPTVVNCTFSDNAASGAGAGMCNCSSSPALTNCTFSNNSAGGGGGVSNSYNCYPTLTNCTFSENSANQGGGIYNYWCEPTLTNCIFASNSAKDAAGGMYSKRSSKPVLTNCTFAANSALNGNALACDSRFQQFPSDLQVANCIFWDGANEVWNNDGSTIAITYSDLQGGWPHEGNIDADPCFVDPCNGDYHLSENSVCINAGDPCYVGDPCETDMDGDPRVLYGRIDIGADEFKRASADFGDCPDPTYPTLLAHDGARHIIDPNVFLGEMIDEEADGQPSAGADGDDVNGLADEDGVFFPSSMFTNCAREVVVIASCEGKLDAWIDSNADGDWGDPCEQVFASEPVSAGSNILTLRLPPGGPFGFGYYTYSTYARFRFSTAGGLDADGPAPDGEVEDYMISMRTDCVSPHLNPQFNYPDWVSWNKPECWCYSRQCRGDTDGIMNGPFWVAMPDLNKLRDAINKIDAVLETIPNGICCDFDHVKTGPFRVAVPDLNILRQYINKSEDQVPTCWYDPWL